MFSAASRAGAVGVCVAQLFRGSVKLVCAGFAGDCKCGVCAPRELGGEATVRARRAIFPRNGLGLGT